MPIYEFECTKCLFLFEDLFKTSDPMPEECPSCKEKGCVKKLISLCSGNVELTGREATQKLWQEGKQMAREMKTNENKAANFLGEDKYQAAVSRQDRIKKDFGKDA